MKALNLGQARLSVEDIYQVAVAHRPVTIAPSALARVARVRSKIEVLLVEGAPLTYGVNTGFGALAEVRIPASELARLQVNLIRSHAAGVGKPFDVQVARAMLLLRANVLLLGTSGARPALPQLLVEMLNGGITPIIPRKGSVGASGDLAPLAHLALVLIGEGRAWYKDEVLAGGKALSKAGLTPITLQAKEGLALINGTQAMTAEAALALHRAWMLAKVADITGAAAVDALLGSYTPFDPRIHAMRPHPGQIAVAENMRRLTANGEVNASHHGCEKVQDPYSLRCMPQVHGASRDAFRYATDVVERELNAATDNPLVFETDDGIEILSGGNFHGQPVAIACDTLAIATHELANISERRVEQLVNPSLSSGLPAFLAGDSGLNSGFMIAQVTAAALVSENKILCHPASVDSIPSSANREDHVSMGTIAARKARAIADNVEHVLAIELLCAMQGLEMRRPLKAGAGVEAALACVRTHVPPMLEDRIIYPDIEAVTTLIRSGALLAAVEAVVGPLK